MKSTNRFSGTRYLCFTAMFVAVEIVMWLLHLGQVPVGALNMSFLTVPVAIGAALLGPGAGAILGMTFGLTSFYDAFSGASVLTGFFFATSPVHTFLLCVGTRTLMGLCTGLIFRAVRRIDRKRILCYYLAALSAPLLNTIFFMGYIVTFLYDTEMVRSLVEKTGAANPFMFVILLVGIQGLVEAVTCTVIGGTVAKGVAKALRLDR